MPYSRKSFQDKELEILRNAVDKADERKGKRIIRSPEIKEIISIVETFLRHKKRVCYGGTAINNILPVEDQFYNKDIELPDYDFFSPNALADAKELADIYYKKGFNEVEAKSGVHHGTFKVFVDFIPVADITQVDKHLYNTIAKKAFQIDGIHYSPPNYLRMLMYLELSRPEGDVSRWEKVLKRITLLNKNFPLKSRKCDPEIFQRSFEDTSIDQKNIYNIVKNSLIDQGVVFFGGYANSLYSKYFPKKEQRIITQYPDFDVLSTEPFKTATIIKEQLLDEGYKHIKIIKRPGVGEIIDIHYELKVGKETLAFIYKPLGCHSYNMINISNRKVKVATIDTMLNFYLAFLYADRPYYDDERILCMSQYLFQVQQKNRLQQKGLLRRFSISCYGQQGTMEEMRSQKAEKYKELKNKRDSKEYEEWFLRYVPSEIEGEKQKKQTKKHVPKKKKGKQKAKRKTRKRKFLDFNF